MKPNLAEVADPKYPLTYPKLASAKLDGIRALTQYGNCVSRSLKPIPNMALRELLTPFQGLDGELIWGEPNSSTVYHDTFSAVMTENGTTDGITFYVFDLLDKSRPYWDRYAQLKDMKLPDFIKVLDQTSINSEEELKVYYDTMLDTGFEGAILRNAAAMYKEGRSTAKSQDMLKFKPFIDSDAVVTGIFEAMHNGNEVFKNELGHTDRSTNREGLTGKGMIGGFLVDYSGQICRIAAGKTSHDERIAIFNNPSLAVGRTLKFRHLAIGAKDAPRHGRFIGWRSEIDV